MLNLNKRKGYPLYLQVADQLRTEILSGKYPPNYAFPEERVLSRQVGVSRVTLRNGLSILEREGLIYKIKGSGVFVSGETHTSAGKGQFEWPEGHTVAVVRFDSFEKQHNNVIARAATGVFHDHSHHVICIGYFNPKDAIDHINYLHKELRGFVFQPGLPATTYKRVAVFARSVNLPVVLMHYDMPGQDLDLVTSDIQGGIRQAIEYFVKSGHTRIGYVCSDRESLPQKSRKDSYVKAMTDHNLKPRVFKTKHKTESSWNPARYGFRMGGQVFGRRVTPTALLTESDYMAVGLLGFMQRNGISVPQDVQLIGFGDDMPYSRLPKDDTYELSTVRIPYEQIGRRAAEVLLNRIENPQTPTQRIILPTELIHRRTTGSPSKIK